MSSVAVASLDQNSKNNLLYAYAALILHDGKVDYTEENFNKIISATGN